MGYYLEPQVSVEGSPSKENFLKTSGKAIPFPTWPPDPGMALICLLKSRHYDAALVCYSKSEVDVAVSNQTFPGKKWYILTKDLCYQAMPQKRADELRGSWDQALYEPRCS